MRIMSNLRILAAVCLVATICSAGNAWAQAGTLDSSFGRNGSVITDFSNLSSGGLVNAVPFAALEQSDGKIVVMGAVTDVPAVASQAIGVVRYLSNGSLDSTFGQGGLALVAFDSYINYGFSMALMADGRIVVAGEEQSSDGSFDRFGIARLNPNGTPDTTFGGSGMVITEFFSAPAAGATEAAHAVIIQSDGKIVAGGGVKAGSYTGLATSVALARYNQDGSLDSTFGSAGKVLTTAASGPAESLALLTDGHILAACGSNMLEIASNGTVQSSVLGGSIVATSTGGTETFAADDQLMQIQAFYVNRSTHIIKVVRFLPGGGADTTFNNSPFNFGGSTGSGNATAIAMQPDGKAVVAGLTTGNGNFGVARLTTNGALDSTFGKAGSITTAFPSSGAATAVAIQSDGKILAVGYVMNSSGAADFALARYLGQ